MNQGPSDSVKSAATAVRPHLRQLPRLAVVLGSGLGGFVDCLEIETSIPYRSIPGMPVSTAMGHAGRLVLGRLDGCPVAVLQGRAHLYEGYTREQVTFSVRLLQALGVETLLLSCAAGGLNPRFNPGDLMLINDTMDLLHCRNRVLGNFSRPCFRPGPAQELNTQLSRCAVENAIPIVQGTYIAVTGPNYETRAEQRFLRMFGDAVGMSTVPEIQVSAEAGMRVTAVAMITNVCTPDAPRKTSGEDVLQVASGFLTDFQKLVVSLAKTL